MCKGGLYLRRRGITALLVIAVLFAMIAAYVFFSYGKIKPDKDRICAGVSIGPVQVGANTREEAETAVKDYTNWLESRKLQVDVNGKTVVSTVKEIGYTFASGDAVEKAMAVGRTGNVIENYQEIKKASEGEFNFPIPFSLDESVLQKFVKKKCVKLCTRAKNAGIKMENGEFVYTESKNGVSIDVDETVKMIKQAVEQADETDVIKVTANVKVEQPSVSKETAAKCKDKLGTFSTTFNASNVNRTKNLSNAARLINGAVIYPGETFSVHDAISPLTEENGYYEAASYNNGKVEDSLGGGVCQVSTTLYNAVLKAELEIVERSPHSMVVSYVEPSMDAAIAGDYKDFKFKNNTDVPVYVQGGTYGGTIYFNIYGDETRDSGREVRFESEVTETIQPGKDKVTYDKTKPESYMEVTQEAHTGYKAKLWKIVTENGEETRTQVNASTYSAAPRYVTKGTQKEPAATSKPDVQEQADNSGGQKNNSQSTDNGSQNSQNSGREAGNGEVSAAATTVPQNVPAE